MWTWLEQPPHPNCSPYLRQLEDLIRWSDPFLSRIKALRPRTGQSSLIWSTFKVLPCRRADRGHSRSLFTSAGKFSRSSSFGKRDTAGSARWLIMAVKSWTVLLTSLCTLQMTPNMSTWKKKICLHAVSPSCLYICLRGRPLCTQ